MWLSGFNDAKGHYPFECEMVECPYSYLAEEFATDFDRTAEEALSPFGSSSVSTPIKGMCPRDSAHFHDKKIAKLGADYIETFDKEASGHFFWNFRNEMEPRWNYITAYDNGWLPSSTPTEFLQ